MTYPTNQIPSINPQNINLAFPVGLQSAARDPTASDNTYIPGSEWQNTISKTFFKCVSSTIAGAVWEPFVHGASGSISMLTANSGGAVGPSGSGNVNIVGDGTTINIVGNPGSNTLTASLVGGDVAVQTFATNVAGPVAPTSAGVLDLNASSSTYTDGTVANTVKIELQGTNHALFVGRGALSPATTVVTGTSGQALVSAGAGADPAFGTLTVPGGGTGVTSLTAYSVLCGGTTSTGNLQQVSGVGTVNQILASRGAAALPVWQTNSMVFLTSAPPSEGFVNLNLANFSTFLRYMIVVENLFPSSNGDTVYMQISTDGITYINSGYQSGVTAFNYNSSTVINYNSTSSFLLCGNCHATGGGSGATGSFIFYNSYYPALSLCGTCQYDDTGNNVSTTSLVGGICSAATQAVALQITSANGGGLVAAGEVSLYGMN